MAINGHNRTTTLASVTLAFALLAGACGGGAETAEPAETTTTVAAETTTTAVVVEEVAETAAPEVTEAEPVEKEPTAVEEPEEVVEEPEVEDTKDEKAEDEPAETAVSAEGARQPGMTLEELEPIIRDAHGPTDDIVAELNRLAYFPEGIPTPPDAVVLDVQISSSHYRFNDSHYRSNIFRVGSSMTGEEAQAFYADALAEQGFTVTGTGSQTDSEGFSAYFVDSDPSDSVNGDKSFDIVIREGEFDGTQIRFWYRGAEPYSGQVEALNTWDPGSPLPDGGLPLEAGFSTAYRDDLEIADYRLNFTTYLEFIDVDDEQLRELLRASLNEAGSELKDGSDLSLNSVFLVSRDERLQHRQLSFYTGSGSNGDYSSITMNTPLTR